MKTRIKTFLILSLVLLCSIIAYIWVYSQIDYQRMTQALMAQSQWAESTFNTEKKATENHLLQLAATIADVEQHQQLLLLGKKAVEIEGGGGGGNLAAQVRNALFEHLKKSHKNLLNPHELQQLQFHLAPGALSFLRMYHPAKFGDRLDDVRFTVVAANKEHSNTAGFETGRSVPALRGVVPVDAFDGATKKQIHVGAVEVGTSFQGLADNLHHYLPWLQVAVLVDKKHLQAKMWPETLAELLRHNPLQHDFYLAATSSPQINTFLHNEEFAAAIQTARSHIFKTEVATYNLRSIPLRDFQGENDPNTPDAGRIVLWSDVSAQMSAYHDRVLRLIFYGVLLFLNLEAIMFVAIRLMTKELQKELEATRKQEEISEQARVVAEESSRIKTEFLGTMSHELRTPLNAIIGMGQILGESHLSDQQQGLLDKINLSSHKLLTIIDEILLLSQLDKQQLVKLPEVSFDPCQLVQTVLAGFSAAAAQQGIELRYDCAAGIPRRVTGHATQLEQVLRQLVGNAIKFSGGNDVNVVVQGVSQTAATVWLEFSIIDHGIGISSEQQSEIFKPFHQGDGSATRAYSGTGLGLTIADKVIHQLGETIKVTSTLGQGSCFNFQLPFTVNAATEAVFARDGSVVTAGQVVAAPQIDADNGTIVELLTRLEEPLAAMHPLPCQEIAKQLQGYQNTQLWSDELEQLLSLIARYRFAEAGQIVASLKTDLMQEKSSPQ